MKVSLYHILLLTILFIIIIHWDTIRVNLIILATIKRGILSQNCFWWSLNDYLPDSTGTEVYTRLKQRGRFVKLTLLGENIYLLTDINDIKVLLDLSPNPFGPGIFKQNFFNTFMTKNVGISVNPEWKYRRDYNDKVLETDSSHHMNAVFWQYIHETFQSIKPTNFEEFTELTRRLTSKILFGTYEYNPVIFKIFKQADSLLSLRFKTNSIEPDIISAFKEYITHELKNPKENTLLYIAHKYHSMLPMDEIIDQIPHWIFPIAGLFSVHLPRLLVMLANHPRELDIVIETIQTKQYLQRENYIRNCILELFRLNNAVNSTFRGLTESFKFDTYDEVFPKGTQFVFFNNPALRDLFPTPNEFKPSRWSSELEKSYTALMFNQGNQRCPGKEITISFLTMGLVSFLSLNQNSIKTNIKIDTTFVPYIINPCTITFK